MTNIIDLFPSENGLFEIERLVGIVHRVRVDIARRNTHPHDFAVRVTSASLDDIVQIVALFPTNELDRAHQTGAAVFMSLKMAAKAWAKE